MRHKVWQVGLLVLLLLALATPVAFAQGTGGDRLVFGQSFVLSEGEQVNGNVVVMGGSATIGAGSVVRGDAVVFGGGSRVAGTIEGSLMSFGGNVALDETAVVKGDVASFGGEVTRAPGSVVGGDVVGGLAMPLPLPFPAAPGRLPVAPMTNAAHTGIGGFLGSLLTWQLITIGWAVLLALLGVILVALAPRATGRIASAAADDTFVSFGMGLLTLVVVGLLGLVLLIACCLGLFVWLALGIAWLVGWIAVGLWVGQRLLNAARVRSSTAIGEVALGVALITVLSRVPWCIGFLFGIVVGCIGLGAVVLTHFGSQPYLGGKSAALGPADPTGADVDETASDIPAAPSAELIVPEPDTPSAASPDDIGTVPAGDESPAVLPSDDYPAS